MSDERIGEHVAALLLHLAKENGGNISHFRDELLALLVGRYDIRLSSTSFGLGLSKLEELGVLQTLTSPLTDDIFQIDTGPVDYYFDDVTKATEDDFGYWEDRQLNRNTHPVINTYYRVGQKWIDKVAPEIGRRELEHAAELEFAAADVSGSHIEIPAADRIVSLSHNQHQELDQAATELVDLVERENSIDGDAVQRDLIIGQLKAGRELIRAQTFRAYLLYNTLLTALGTLIDKYAGAAVGVAAAKLLELLIEQVFTI